MTSIIWRAVVKKVITGSLVALICIVCIAYHAHAQCSIEWWGDLNGSELTSETSRTAGTAWQLFEILLPEPPEIFPEELSGT